MIEEKEYKLLTRLYHLPEVSGSIFRRKGATKPDIELKVNETIRDKNFDVFWKSLMNKKIIILLKEMPNPEGGNLTKLYTINKSKLFKYISLFSIYQDTKNIVRIRDV